MSRGDDWGRISQRLHDARLQHLEWDETLGHVRLEFDPLRRNTDGSDLADRTITFRLNGVRAIVVGYESGLTGVRPSQYRPERLLQADDLIAWPFAPHEVFVSVNSRACLDDVLGSPLVRWLFGDQDGLDDCEVRLIVSFQSTPMLGLPTNHVRLLFSCEGFEILAGETPLDLETWGEQYAAWWEGWRRYWAEERSEEAEGVTGHPEEVFIPAGAPEPPDPSYRPPSEPPAAWEPTDLPEELLLVLTDWMEATHDRDWPRLARAYPNLDLTPRERAEQLAEWAEQDAGRWWYARQIDSWWVEGMHAEVAVRGVEHTMPDEEDPGKNTETVWTAQLRRRPEGWIVRGWSQGWPAYGSAPSLPLAEKPWVQRWRSGTILSERADS